MAGCLSSVSFLSFRFPLLYSKQYNIDTTGDVTTKLICEYLQTQLLQCTVGWFARSSYHAKLSKAEVKTIFKAIGPEGSTMTESEIDAKQI